MAVFRTALFFAGWVVATLVMGVAGIPFLLLPQRYIWGFNGAWARFTLWWLRVTCGVRGSSDGVLLIEDGSAEVDL